MRSSIFPAAALAAVLLAAAPAAAGELPGYDAAAYCRLVTNAIRGPASLMGSCLGREEAARARLSGEWASVPADTRGYCDGVARSIGSSYDILAGCVTQERERRPPSAMADGGRGR